MIDPNLDPQAMTEFNVYERGERRAWTTYYVAAAVLLAMIALVAGQIAWISSTGAMQ